MDRIDEFVEDQELPKISTGNAGLERHSRRRYRPRKDVPDRGAAGLRQDDPGALEFLLEGVRLGEPSLYITLSETERELRLVAKRHGWSLEGITVFELVPSESSLWIQAKRLTVLQPAELELSETTQMIFDKVEALAPARIVLDSLSELRLLAHRARSDTVVRSWR